MDKVTTTGMDMNAVTDMDSDMDNLHGHHQNFANVVFTSFYWFISKALSEELAEVSGSACDSYKKLAEVLAEVLAKVSGR